MRNDIERFLNKLLLHVVTLKIHLIKIQVKNIANTQKGCCAKVLHGSLPLIINELKFEEQLYCILLLLICF